MIVLPIWDIFLNVCIILLSVPGSRPLVGSSKKNKFGSANNSTAILALFLWPPLSCLINEFSKSVKLTISKTSFILWLRSFFEVLSGILNFAAYCNISCKVKLENTISSWGTYPILYFKFS